MTMTDVELGDNSNRNDTDPRNVSTRRRRIRRQPPTGEKQQQEQEQSLLLKRKKRKRRNKKNDDIPFWLLFLKVGLVVFVAMVLIFGLLMRNGKILSFNSKTKLEEKYDDSVEVEEEEEPVNIEELAVGGAATTPTISPTASPLPIWDLSPKGTYYDAYGLVHQFRSDEEKDWKHQIQNWLGLGSSSNVNNDDSTRDTKKRYEEFWNLTKNLRQEFADLYGGENAARALLERGLTTFGESIGNTTRNIIPPPSPDLITTACRFRSKQKERKDENSDSIFRIAFGGYSVTTGRGNYFHQSYPFVMQRKLEPIFATLGIELQVRNAAIGGVPSFPYGWCFENFWQLSSENVDVVSWDYSMNEAGGISQGIEAYIRQIYAATHYDNSSDNDDEQLPPLLIVKDTHMAEERRNLLRKYVSSSSNSNNNKILSKDTIVMHTDPAIQPFLNNRKEEDRPIGFKNWRKFGAPPGAPGQSAHHPAVAEHTLMGWMLTMHFLAALEYYVLVELEGTTIIDSLPSLEEQCASQQKFNNEKEQQQQQSSNTKNNNAPPSRPMYPIIPTNDTSLSSSILFSTTHRIHCRTSYEPIITGKLSEIVTSGVALFPAQGGGEEEDTVSSSYLPKKGLHEYNRGWVLDLSNSERLAKRKLDRYGGLGFVDSKKAYYGLYNSGSISFHLPLSKNDDNNDKDHNDRLKSIVLCQVNERERPINACEISTHLDYWIGGVGPINKENSTMISIMNQPGTLYLGHSLCVHFSLSSLMTAAAATTTTTTTGVKEGELPELSTYNEIIGINVTAKVRDIHIRKPELACSISHVVWEEEK